MASRALRLENVLPSGRVLAKDTADCTEKHEDQTKRTDDSPGHIALLIIRTERHFGRAASTVNLIYHKICLTQIKLLRLIGFGFVP
jgi:hypothetical protein